MYHPAGANKVAPKMESEVKKLSTKPTKPARPSRVKFKVFGEEMIEKEVKPSGNSGRIYLPLDWVGKRIKIIRIE